MTWRWISEGKGARLPDLTRPPALRDWLNLVVLTLVGVAAAGLAWRQPVPLVGKLLYKAALVYAVVQPWRFELRRVERSRSLRSKLTAAVRSGPAATPSQSASLADGWVSQLAASAYQARSGATTTIRPINETGPPDPDTDVPPR